MAAAPRGTPQLHPRRKGSQATRRASLIGWLMGALLAAQGRNVAAQSSDGDNAPRHVEIKLVSAGDATGGLEGSLRELLTRLQVTVHFANAGSVDEHHILSPHPANHRR